MGKIKGVIFDFVLCCIALKLFFILIPQLMSRDHGVLNTTGQTKARIKVQFGEFEILWYSLYLVF